MTTMMYYKRHLPHIQEANSILFITFRLAGSLPRSVTVEASRDTLDLAREDPELAGPTWLADERIAEIVYNHILSENGHFYRLDGFCIMPNHVHLICLPLQDEQGKYYQLPVFLRRLKGATAREANLILGRTGAFWQAESYDYLIRNEAEWQRIMAYVKENPVKAGLTNSWEEWRWAWYNLE